MIFVWSARIVLTVQVVLFYNSFCIVVHVVCVSCARMCQCATVRNCSAFVCACEWDLWNKLHFDRSSIPVHVKVWVGCSVGCWVL